MGSASLLPAIARRCRLEGKVALITGGAGGIGEAAARLFSQHGAKVVIADIQDELGEAVSRDISPSLSSFVHCDVTNESDVQNAVDTAVFKHGKLDIMMNNAGSLDPMRSSLLEYQKSDFEAVLRTNLTGAFLGTKHAARVMIPARRGSILFTASAASVVAGAMTHAYTCSKHAIVGLTRNVAVELGQYGIRVNCLSAYGLASAMTKKFLRGASDEEIERYFGERANLEGVTLRAEDVAQAALYLASEESKYVSGHNLVVDGGFSLYNSSLCAFKQSST